jgi:hypothetical protein
MCLEYFKKYIRNRKLAKAIVAKVKLESTFKYYNSIDIPLYNWIKIQEGKIEYSRKNLEQGNIDLDEVNSILIKDSYYSEFGVSKEYLRVLELYKEISEAKLDWIIDNDEFILNKIRRLERGLKELLERPIDGDIDTNLIILSKWIGYPVRQKETTVREFYKMVKSYSKEIEARKKTTTDGKN